MADAYGSIAKKIAHWCGHQSTFLLALSVIAAWILTGPIFGFSDTWQLVINTGTTIITFLMVFLIQNTQNRDGAAIQAKLDELLRAVSDARNEFIGIEHLTEEELDEIRKDIERVAYGDDLDDPEGKRKLELLRASFLRMSATRTT